MTTKVLKSVFIHVIMGVFEVGSGRQEPVGDCLYARK